MSNKGIRRTFRTPKGYVHEQGNRVALFNQTYLGFVKDNQDAFKMGRLRVWIPEFSKDPTDEDGWFTVNYCSPFAGATPARDIKKESKKLEDTQQSYGWWAVPPDLDNEVVVMFINGDPNRGVWIGCLYQQFMNHMVPGIASNNSYQEGVDGTNPPVAEYNKWGGDVGNHDNPTRPRFEPLHEGLKNQGLYQDYQRGPTDASARRDPVPNVYGFKSPGGSQFVFDDDENNQYVRIRTKTGAQVLINDTTGFVYINSRNGNSWIEISDDGIDMYTAKSFSVRSQQDINFHADGNINMYAKKQINLYSGRSSSWQAGKNLDILVGDELKASSAGSLNLLSTNSIAVKSAGDFSLQAGGTNSQESGGATSLSSGGTMYLSSPSKQMNGGKGPKPKSAKEASGPEPQEASDRELNVQTNYGEINTRTIVSRLVTHEPFDLHPAGPTAPVRQRVDLSVSTRNQVDGNASVDTGNPDDIPADAPEEIVTDDATFVCPTTGPVTSLFGPRKSPARGASTIHKGVDVGVPIGTPVIAMRDGTVTKAGWGTGYGNVIYIRHDDGYETRYAHLSKFNVSVGQKVKQGMVIAKSGNTGIGSGPHLHFEIRKNGNGINPSQKLPDIRKGARMIAGKGLPPK